jgi:hypothetical protein
LAQALLDSNADTLFPLDLGADFASRLVKYMQLRNFWLARMPGFLNIVYAEGTNENGTVNADEFNKFNDRRMVITIADGKPKILLNVLATTEPGRFFHRAPAESRRRCADRIWSVQSLARRDPQTRHLDCA